MGEEGDCTYRYIVITRMSPALRWAAMRVNLMFHNCEGHSHKTVSTYHDLFQEKGELKQNQAKALLLTRPTPYREAKLVHCLRILKHGYI